MIDKDRIKYLLEQYMAGQATDEEYRLLFDALSKQGDREEWVMLLQQFAEAQAADPVYDPSRWEPVITKILQEKVPRKAAKHSRLFIFLRGAAAVIIMVLGLGIWFTMRHSEKKSSLAAAVVHDVPPGGNKAMLTLANGKTIVLDSMVNGMIARQGNTRVLKIKAGSLVYNKISRRPADIVYNTLRTPRGGQYEVILPDSSKVWLNSASSVRFPTAFAGGERDITLSGEAYFEVTRNDAEPFIVRVGGMQVKVLGTHFNVMAYAEEPVIKTTLLEGAVKVIKGNETALLKPGQQARLYKDGKMQLIKDADVEEAVAWKKGLFEFTDAGVDDIMRQIARWYDIQIAYASGIPSGHITGKIPRNTNLSNVLKMMKLSGVHFKLEDRKLIILPN